MNSSSTNIISKAILVVSFGTSFRETCKKNIKAIEQAIKNAHTGIPVYRAWTSKRIIKKLKNTQNLHIDTVSEAFERMKANGITDVIVQPTHVINGFEASFMMDDIQKYISDFHSIRCGAPLLTSDDDCSKVADLFCGLLPDLTEEKHFYVLMGHGTEHQADSIYQKMNELFVKNGRADIMIATVEGKITIDDIVEKCLSGEITKVTMMPFMIVAGDHAHNDMAGEDEDSWASILRQNGISSNTILKGLGEYPEIQNIFIQHCQNAIENSN